MSNTAFDPATAERLQKELGAWVYQFRPDILAEVTTVLHRHRYSLLQYLPGGRSRLALAREPQHLVNLFARQHFHLFKTSAVPGLYQKILFAGKASLALLYSACYQNDWVPRRQLEAIFGEELVRRAIENLILIDRGDSARFTLSLVPFREFIVLRDPAYTYSGHRHQIALRQRVWMGADSVVFAELLADHLKGSKLDSTLDMGCGTGIQAMMAARHSRCCLAADYNPRAVAFTRLNAHINELPMIEARVSNLFSGIEEKFDLVLANPWHCNWDSETLEEIPGIVDGLQQHLKPGGRCLMVVNAYVRKGRDILVEFMEDFCRRHEFDVEMRAVNHNVELHNQAALQAGKDTYRVFYFVILKKTGRPRLVRLDLPIWKKWRDNAHIQLLRRLHS